MPRIKRGLAAKKKHRKTKKAVKGFIHSRRASIKKAREALFRAGFYSFRDRRRKKSQFRKLWILKLNAALREKNLKYSQFINLLKKNKIEINRKILAEIAEKEPQVFAKILEKIT